MRNAVLMLVLVCLIAQPAFCQDAKNRVRDRTIREAQSLTRYGNNEQALQLLEGLYAQSPQD